LFFSSFFWFLLLPFPFSLSHLISFFYDSILQEKLSSSQGTKIVESVLEKELNEKELSLSKALMEIESLKSLVKSSENHVEQFKKIASSNETLLKEMTSKQTDFLTSYEKEKESLLLENSRLSEEILLLKESSSSLLTELEETRNQAITSHMKEQELINSLKHDLERISNENTQLSQNTTSLMEEINKLQSFQTTSYENYERELQLHAESEKKLKDERMAHNKTKERLSISEEKIAILSSDLIKLSQQHTEELSSYKQELLHNQEMLNNLQKSNDLLHNQIQSYGNQIEKLQEERVNFFSSSSAIGAAATSFSLGLTAAAGERKEGETGEGEESATSSSSSSSLLTMNEVLTKEVEELRRSSNEMRELLRYMKREKEMLSTKVQILESENSRYSSQVSSLNKSLEEIRNELKVEVEKKMTLHSDEEFQLLVSELNQLAVLRESNLHLRKENESFIKKIQQLTLSLEEEKMSSLPLQEKIKQLSNEKENMELANDQLTNDITYWKNRLHSLVSRYNDIDPIEHQQLQSKLEETNKMIVTLEEKVKFLENANHEALMAKEKEVEDSKAAAAGANNIANSLREKARQFRDKYIEVDTKLKEVNKNNASKETNTSVMEQQLKESQTKVIELTKEVNEMKGTLANMEKEKERAIATAVANAASSSSSTAVPPSADVPVATLTTTAAAKPPPPSQPRPATAGRGAGRGVKRPATAVSTTTTSSETAPAVAVPSSATTAPSATTTAPPPPSNPPPGSVTAAEETKEAAPAVVPAPTLTVPETTPAVPPSSHVTVTSTTAPATTTAAAPPLPAGPPPAQQQQTAAQKQGNQKLKQLLLSKRKAPSSTEAATATTVASDVAAAVPVPPTTTAEEGDQPKAKKAKVEETVTTPSLPVSTSGSLPTPSASAVSAFLAGSAASIVPPAPPSASEETTTDVVHVETQKNKEEESKPQSMDISEPTVVETEAVKTSAPAPKEEEKTSQAVPASNPFTATSPSTGFSFNVTANPFVPTFGSSSSTQPSPFALLGSGMTTTAATSQRNPFSSFLSKPAAEITSVNPPVEETVAPLEEELEEQEKEPSYLGEEELMDEGEGERYDEREIEENEEMPTSAPESAIATQPFNFFNKPQQSQSSFSFGNTSSGQSSSSIFGQAGSTAAPFFNPSSTSVAPFGSSTASIAPTGGLFGTGTSGGGGLGGLFAKPTSTSIFGSAPPSTSSSSSGFGLFSNKGTTAGSHSLFTGTSQSQSLSPKTSSAPSTPFSFSFGGSSSSVPVPAAISEEKHPEAEPMKEGGEEEDAGMEEEGSFDQAGDDENVDETAGDEGETVEQVQSSPNESVTVNSNPFSTAAVPPKVI
jgi:nucleoprotein TPR